MKNLFLEKSIDIRAGAAAVWRQCVAPYVSDWEVGAALRGKTLEGKILKIEPEKVLKHNILRRDGEGVMTLSSVVTYELREHQGMTILVARESFAEAQSDKAFAEALARWEATLHAIKEAAEQR